MSKRFSYLRGRLLQLSVVAIASGMSTAFIVGIRQLGGLQALELNAYDRLMQLRPTPALDSRILVVGITEADIQALGGQLQLEDGLYAQAIAKLLKHQPRLIGLDIYRDQPFGSGHAALVQQFQSSARIFGITKLGDGDHPTIAAPPALPRSQVGFNDVVVDAGGIIRRNLLYAADDQGETMPSLALQLALRYLEQETPKITAQPSAINPDHLQLGAAVFIPLQPNDGGYIAADTRGYQVMLNYRGRGLSFPQVSLGQLLKDRVDPALVRDRIVLIGNVSESGKDFFYTPFSSGLGDNQRLPGVLVHGQMVSQLLDAATGQRPLIWFWTKPQEILWIACWALIGGLLAWRIRQPLILVLGTAISLTSLVGVSYGLFLVSGWVPLVPPALALLLTTGSVVSYTAQQASQQQKMVMRLLGQNTSPEIAETLWQQRDQLLKGGKLPGQGLIATLLFTDLKGFSTIAERMTPEALLVWLNAYLDEVTQVVQFHQGVINKFTGDGIMAAFGVPIPRQTPAEIALDAQRAVACALAMGDRLNQLNQRWQNQGLPEVEMRAGIFTGPVVVGSLGGKSRLEYGIIGDSVNTASRLESVDKHRQPTPCRVLIAQETLDYLQSHYEVEPWGPLELKGKQKKIQVYRVIGSTATTPPTLILNRKPGSE